MIRLRRLSDNELLALVRRLTKLYAQREGLDTPPLTDEQITAFMNRALSRAGAEELITPREIIRDYLTLLNILRDNEGVSFDQLLSKVTAPEAAPSEESAPAPIAPKKKIGLFYIDI